ncbi:MAG: metallophosphoesterase, partial [Rubripirellula sp.]
VSQLCFMGHTHLPGVFTTECEFISPDECDHHYKLGREKILANVGSVGQPRDDNSKSCYVILDTDEKSLTYRRVDYDRDKTANKIYNIPDLSDALGDRLKHGR